MDVFRSIVYVYLLPETNFLLDSWYTPVQLATGDPIFCKNSKVQFYNRK